MAEAIDKMLSDDADSCIAKQNRVTEKKMKQDFEKQLKNEEFLMRTADKERLKIAQELKAKSNASVSPSTDQWLYENRRHIRQQKAMNNQRIGRQFARRKPGNLDTPTGAIGQQGSKAGEIDLEGEADVDEIDTQMSVKTDDQLAAKRVTKQSAA